MADNTLFSTLDPHRSFDNEGLEILPLLTKERTQKFELLQHLIPNLKQHLIVSGASGIGKTFLLDQLYDLNSDAWQCCFVQGSSELSFETIEAQLTKAMLRNKHASLESALHNFAEQHKKIVLIIDDAGLLVSGLMTTLIDYAATQNVIKLLFSLTPDARNAHRQTDKALNDCYLLEIPPLSKNQSAFFLRQLAAKPRTYGSLQIDEKLVDKIYHDSQGIPAKIIADFTKLSRQEKNDYTKWLVVFAGVLVSAMVINQVIKHFTTEELPVETAPILPVENIEKAPVSQSESPAKTEQLDIVIPEFQLDIEKGIVTPSENIKPDTAPVEKPSDPTPAPVIEPTIVVEPEKVIESKKSAEPIPATPEPVKVIEPVVEKLLEPEKVVEPSIAFPKVEPAKGMKIQALPEKTMLQAIPIPAPVVKKIEIKPVEKPAEVKKPEPPKVESPKIEPPKVEAIKKVEQSKVELEKDKKTEATLNSTGRYVLQLITLSSEAAVEAFQKKHADLGKNLHVVKSGSAENPRFGLVYGGFENAAEATKAREKLPPEFANALPRKN
jgi:DamX protein